MNLLTKYIMSQSLSGKDNGKTKFLSLNVELLIVSENVANVRNGSFTLIIILLYKNG
jgi:hypothetical protein